MCSLALFVLFSFAASLHAQEQRIAGGFVFYNASTGAGAIGWLTDATSSYIPGGTLSGLGKGWTHVVGHMSTDLALFYNTSNGKCAIASLRDGSVRSLPRLESGWTHISAGGDNMFLFYNASTGEGAIAFVNIYGVHPLRKISGLGKGWSHMVVMQEKSGLAQGVLFYDAFKGGGSTGYIVDSLGKYTRRANIHKDVATFFSYQTDPPNPLDLVGWKHNPWVGWTHVAYVSFLLFYDTANVSGYTAEVDNVGCYRHLGIITPTPGPFGRHGLGAGWTHVTGNRYWSHLGFREFGGVLLYNKSLGNAVTGTVSFNNFQVGSKISGLGTGWTHIAATGRPVNDHFPIKAPARRGLGGHAGS